MDKLTCHLAPSWYVYGWYVGMGHVISCNLNDNLDIERHHNKLVAQVNSVLCNSVIVDAIVKMKLLKNYCLSLYGCELWHLCNTGIERICKAWRMGVRRVWSLIVEHLYYK